MATCCHQKERGWNGSCGLYAEGAGFVPAFRRHSYTDRGQSGCRALMILMAHLICLFGTTSAGLVRDGRIGRQRLTGITED
jgi:hypothetical protein